MFMPKEKATETLRGQDNKDLWSHMEKPISNIQKGLEKVFSR